MRQLKATLKDGGRLSATDHIHCSVASHCFPPGLGNHSCRLGSCICSQGFGHISSHNLSPGTACNAGLKLRVSFNVSDCDADSS